jgi:iron(III) transport system substrate-binding protein
MFERVHTLLRNAPRIRQNLRALENLEKRGRPTSVAAFASFIFFQSLGIAPSRAADQSLIDAAKKEGRVTWYTTQIINEFVLPVAQIFEKKYGIKIDYVRAQTKDIALRVLNEARAGKIDADVVDGTLTPPALEKQGLILKWRADGSDRLPKEYVDPQGYWVATNVNIITPGFNTDLVPPDSAPKSYQDLLDPRWKGKMAWSSSPGATAGGPGFIGTVLTEMGEQNGLAYLHALAGQNIAGLSLGARQVLDQVIAGEYPIALQIFNYHTVISASQGAPVGWIPMNPGTGVVAPISILAGAPHMNAAKLLVDFLVSPEGQALYRDKDMLPSDPSVPPRVATLLPDGAHFRAIFFTPEAIEESMPKWTKIFQDLFR